MSIVATSKAIVRWPDQQTVPLDGAYNVYADDRDGAVDYSSPINATPIGAWPDEAGKVGDGLGPDGYGPDGYGHGGIGDGQGADGFGFDGFGAPWVTLVTEPMLDGTWTFGVVGADQAGNPASPAAGTECEVTLAGTPKPPASVAADSWNNATGVLTVTLGLSPDDEG